MPDIITLRAGALRLDLAPQVGGAIARFDAGGQPVMRPAPADLDDPLAASCFPLAPFSNRVRDGRFAFRGRAVQLDANMPGQAHPLHGQVWRSAWTAVRQADRSATLDCLYEPGDWPWAYTARQVFDLDEAGLTVTLSVTNRSLEPMPCGLGLHPYFPCTAQTQLDALVEGVWTIDAEVMPVARQAASGRYCLRERRICGADLDNGYDGWSGGARICWPERSLELTLAADAGFFQVYAPSAGALFVAEGVTHANAALNLPEDQWGAAGLTVLEPGGTQQLITRFDVRTLSSDREHR